MAVKICNETGKIANEYCENVTEQYVEVSKKPKEVCTTHKQQADVSNNNLNKPSGKVSVSVCRDSGMKATDKCTDVYTEEFVEGTVPSACDKH